MAAIARDAAENIKRRSSGIPQLPARFEINGCVVDAFVLMDSNIAIGIGPSDLWLPLTP
jgi:hypothetical protein